MPPLDLTFYFYTWSYTSNLNFKMGIWSRRVHTMSFGFVWKFNWKSTHVKHSHKHNSIDFKLQNIFLFTSSDGNELLRICEFEVVQRVGNIWICVKVVKLVTRENIKILWLGNGGEFTSKKLNAFLVECGIQQTTNPYSSQQNGVAKWANTIMECDWNMILGQGLENVFWVKVVNIGVYIKNQYPTKSIDSKT